MAKKKRQKVDELVQYAKAYARSPKSYEMRGPLLCVCLMLAGVGIFLYGIYNGQGAMEKNAEFVTIKLAEWTLFGAVGVVAIALAFLLILLQSYIMVAYETVQRLNEIKQVLIANADVLKGVDALKLDDIAPPPPRAEEAKTGIDAEGAAAEHSGEQGGEDVCRRGSGGWWKDGEKSA